MGMYVEAVLDPETGDLVANQTFRVLDANGVDEALIFNYNVGTGEYTPMPQPISSDSSGNLRFWANPGYYNISRGSSPTLVEVYGARVYEVPDEVTREYLSNFDSVFQPENYGGVTFHRAYMPQANIADDLELAGPFPEPAIYYYEGASDITITFSAALCQAGTQFVFYQLGTGEINFTATVGTLSNYYSHTKTAGAKAVALVTCVGQNNSDEPEYVLSGITA